MLTSGKLILMQFAAANLVLWTAVLVAWDRPLTALVWLGAAWLIWPTRFDGVRVQGVQHVDESSREETGTEGKG